MLKQFKSDTRGNVAMMTTIAMLAVLTGVAAAIDITAVSKRKNDIQNFADIAVLAASSSGETEKTKLEKVIKAALDLHNVQKWKMDVDVDIVDGEVRLEINSDYDTMLMGLVGRNEMPVKVVTAAPVAGQTPINLTLVLDTTDSMSGDNITSLKSAAKSMIDELEDFKAPVAVSVVPFGQYVNIGLDKKGKTWLDTFNDGHSETYEHCWDETVEITPRRCTKTGKVKEWDIWKDGRKVGKGKKDEEVCTGGDRKKTGVTKCETRTRHYVWHGCVGSRDAPYNLEARFNGQRVPGMINRKCGTEMLELTNDLDTVEAVIESLTTSGDTYLPSGIMWGWRTLDNRDPLTLPSKVSSEQAGKPTPVRAMVIMTDGKNTLSQNGMHHEGRDEAAANTHTATLCNAVKGDNIKVFTVGYRTADVDLASRNVVKNCATDASHHFNAANAEELKQAFETIAGLLDTTRIMY